MAEVNGTVVPGFERVRDVFEANFAERGEIGAACSVWVGGREVVDLVGGVVAPGGDQPYTRQTLQMVASATKGAMVICALRLAERASWTSTGRSPRTGRSSPPMASPRSRCAGC
jgi:CubicO group peptidase (beta-lactamase class C family)